MRCAPLGDLGKSDRVKGGGGYLIFMAIPNYQEIMLPVLKTLSEHGSMRTTDCAELIAKSFGLSEEESIELLPSGKQRTIVNRTAWSSWYLMQAGLLSRPKRGWIEITPEGRNLLHENPSHIDRKTLMRYPQFAEKMSNEQYQSSIGENESYAVNEKTPDERIETAILELRSSLISNLNDQLAKVDPYRFEQIVLDLLLALGYGGSRKEAAQVTQRSSDHGIDGVINEDRLGLDVIYIQAKRWGAKVGRPELQNFAGALSEKRANKGIFITTGEFHSNAREFVDKAHHKIILIDGKRLAELMIDNNIGVACEQIYQIKRIDSDYFEAAE